MIIIRARRHGFHSMRKPSRLRRPMATHGASLPSLSSTAIAPAEGTAQKPSTTRRRQDEDPRPTQVRRARAWPIASCTGCTLSAYSMLLL